jgi:hypothetical protein
MPNHWLHDFSPHLLFEFSISKFFIHLSAPKDSFSAAESIERSQANEQSAISNFAGLNFIYKSAYYTFQALLDSSIK